MGEGPVFTSLDSTDLRFPLLDHLFFCLSDLHLTLLTLTDLDFAFFADLVFCIWFIDRDLVFFY